MLTIKPCELRDANAFVEKHHRHHKKVQGHRWSIAAWQNGRMVGVAIVGRPVARKDNPATTVEITRLCTDGTRNAASRLYGAVRRIAFSMGYEKVKTFILKSEPGTSLFAAGYEETGESGGGSWSRDSRPREDKHPLGRKKRFVSTNSEAV